VAIRLPAQSIPGVRNVYAFMVEHQPGNIPVDPTGTPLNAGPDTLYTVYVETIGQGIQWKRAYIRGRAYTITARRVEKTPFEAGIRKSPREKIVLQAGKGGRLWQLSLDAIAGKPAYRANDETLKIEQRKIQSYLGKYHPLPEVDWAGPLVLEGTRGHKKVVLRVDNIILLKEIPSV